MISKINKLTIEQELEIINKKKDGYSLKSIMCEYYIKNPKTIYDIIKRNGRDKLIANKKYNVNENFFENIDTEEKAYWLGFLYADGYVRMKYDRSGELKLKLGIKDKGHVELFSKSIESNHKIKDFISDVIVDKIKHSSMCSSLSIYNTKIVKDLYIHGCTNKKTFTIRFPNLDKELERHFIRGYFDGDGCIHLYRNSKNSIAASCTISSNYDFIFDLLGIIGYGNIYKQGNIYNLRIGKKNDIIKLYDYLYCDSTFYLGRKKDIFDKHLNTN